ncbi:MAG TPA: sugar ABC transporter permease [Firmicutes bacterium]|nr:sugar ABC transporter permease [Bacillota bacterium]
MAIPLLVLFLGFTIYPFFYMIGISFTNCNLSAWEVPKWVGLKNYATIFDDLVAAGSVEFTILLVLIAVPLEMLLGLFVAFLIDDVVGESFWRSIVVLPMMIPPVVAGIAWKMLYNFQYGPVNYFLSFFGIHRISWLGDPVMARVGVIIADVWQWTPFVFLVLYSGLQSVPQDLIEAASVDGASRWHTIRYVHLPVIRPLVWVVLIIRLVDVLKLFDIVYMVTFGGPGSATHTISYYIYKVGLSFGWDIGYASALSVLLLIAVVLLTNVLIRVLNVRQLLGL